MQQETFKNIIIGFGKGGKTLAKMLASKGEQVAVIEQDEQMYGGTCINVGCIPSKALLTASQKGTAFTKAIADKNTLVTKLRAKNYAMIADQANATVITGKARFLSNTEIVVTAANGLERHLLAERFFINTGSLPVYPAINGLTSSNNILTSKEAMNLQELPEHLVIIGSGYIGLEFATMFSKFGSKVTVLDSFTTFLPREDKDISEAVLTTMTGQGIDFKLGVLINKIEDVNGQTVIAYHDQTGEHSLTANKILVATGRRPNTEGLGLEHTIISTTEQGAIVVDEQLKTTAANIWAIGDVHGGPQFTYTSLDDYRIITNQLFGDGGRTLNNRGPVPYSVFISPPLSSVGLKEEQLIKQGLPYMVLKLEASAIPKAHILQKPFGLLKALVNPTTKTIYGVTFYAEESHELINLITLAIQAQLPYTMLATLLYTHPTMAEALNDLFK